MKIVAWAYDMACNGVIEMADVPLFVEALLEPAAFDAARELLQHSGGSQPLRCV